MIPSVAVTKASTTMSRRSNGAPRGVIEAISSNAQVRIPDRNEKLLKLFAMAWPVPVSSTQSKRPPPMKSYARAVNITDSQTPACSNCNGGDKTAGRETRRPRSTHVFVATILAVSVPGTIPKLGNPEPILTDW
jgi:hypothetical protein